MTNMAAALDRVDTSTNDATTFNEPSLPGANLTSHTGMKFSYLSGSRPLDGYTIKQGVGIGGFGEVYFALSDAGKEVALKRIQRNLEIEVRGVRQCLNLKHHNLVDLYDIKYDANGGAWVVMEFITGDSLKEVIDRHPHGMPPADVRHWFDGIAAGVAYLHDQGIVHRDLKPGNIFNERNVIKIGDYGLSKFISCSGGAGQTESVGTFHYMAPEIGRGVYGKGIDIYALGIMLYEMLAGHVPFDGESSQEIIMRHLTEDPDLTGIPPPFTRVIRTALAKDPGLRYTDIKQMVAELHAPEALKSASDSHASKSRVSNGPEDVLYITDEPPPKEMVFGPVCQRTVPRRATSSSSRGKQPFNPVALAATAQQLPTQVAGAWNQTRMSTPLKVALSVLLLAAIGIHAPWLLPISFVAAAVVGTVATIRFFHSRPRSAPAVNDSGIRFRSWQQEAEENLRAKRFPTRLGELSGSWLAAAIVAGLLSLVLAVSSDVSAHDVDAVARYAWLTVSASIGAWGVLATGKFNEGHKADPIRRRAVMFIVGLLVGLVSYSTSQALLVDLSAFTSYATPPQANFTLPQFLLFFGGLFAIPRWWKQSDPLRRSRISLLGVGVCVLWSLALTVATPFPQPWGLLIAMSISLSAQLAAPWIATNQRQVVSQAFQRA